MGYFHESVIHISELSLQYYPHTENHEDSSPSLSSSNLSRKSRQEQISLQQTKILFWISIFQNISRSSSGKVQKLEEDLFGGKILSTSRYRMLLSSKKAVENFPINKNLQLKSKMIEATSEHQYYSNTSVLILNFESFILVILIVEILDLFSLFSLIICETCKRVYLSLKFEWLAL